MSANKDSFEERQRAVTLKPCIQIRDCLDFKRPTGFLDRGPRKYIDDKLPSCPFCRSKEPLWEHAVQTGWLNRAHFRCQKCLGTLSVPMATMMAKKSPYTLFGKVSPWSEQLKVESVGNTPTLAAVADKLVSREFSINQFQKWANRPDAQLQV